MSLCLFALLSVPAAAAGADPSIEDAPEGPRPFVPSDKSPQPGPDPDPVPAGGPGPSALPGRDSGEGGGDDPQTGDADADETGADEADRDGTDAGGDGDDETHPAGPPTVADAEAVLNRFYQTQEDPSDPETEGPKLCVTDCGEGRDLGAPNDPRPSGNAAHAPGTDAPGASFLDLSPAAASLFVAVLVALSWLAHRFVPALLGSRLERQEAAAHPTRRAMLDHLERHPGATTGELARHLGIGAGRATYHLSILVRERLVRSRRIERHRRFFPEGAPRIPEEVLGVRDLKMTDRPTGRIVQILGRAPGATLSELARQLGMSPGQTHYHVAKLHDGGLIERVRRGRRVRHYLSAMGRSLESRVQLSSTGPAAVGEAAPA